MKRFTRRCLSAPKHWYFASPHHSCKIPAMQKCLIISLPMVSLPQIKFIHFRSSYARQIVVVELQGFLLLNKWHLLSSLSSTAVEKLKGSVLFCFGPGRCFCHHSEKWTNKKTASVVFFSFSILKSWSFFGCYFPISSKVIQIITKRDQRRWFFS